MRNSKKMFDTKEFQRYGIRTFGQGAASVMIASGLFFLAGGTASASDVQSEDGKNLKIEHLETSPTKTENIQNTVKNESGSTPLEEGSKETGKKVESSATAKEVAERINAKLEEQKNAEKTSKVIVETKELRNVLAELEETLAKAAVTDNTKSTLEKAKKAIEEAKSVLSDENSTQENVNKAVTTIRDYKYVIASMPKEGSQRETRVRTVSNSLESARSGQSGFRNIDASTGIGADVIDSTSTPKVEKPGFTPELLARQLKEQVMWVDFSDTKSWSGIEKEGNKVVLKVGAVYTKEVIPGYKVQITIKSMKPFNATEVYKKRLEAAGLDLTENGYDPNAKNRYISGQNLGQYNAGTEMKVVAEDQGAWSELKKQGVNTGNKGTTLSAEYDGGNIGVQFGITATYKGHVVKPAIVMADGESANPGELIMFTTNGGGWTHVGEWARPGTVTDPTKNVNMETYRSQDLKGLFKAIDDNAVTREVNGVTVNFGSPYGNLGKLKNSKAEKIKWELYSNNDLTTGGLGSGVFGPVITAPNNGKEHGAPILMTTGATDIGMYIISGGKQSAMIGFFPLDESDAPESYGVAKHAISQIDGVTGQTVPQPYLGDNRPDMDEGLDRANKPWKADDNADDEDEGVNQILPTDLKDKTNHLIKMDRTKEGNYTLSVKAHTGGANKAFLKGWIDFNQNGVFDENEGSELTEITKDGTVVLHFNQGPSMDDLTTKELGVRVRITKHDTGEDILKPTGFALSGEVEDFKTQITYPPKGEKQETKNYKGFTQTTTVKFTPQGSYEYNLSKDTEIDLAVNPVMIDNKTKTAVTPGADGYYHVEGEGKYKITANGKDVNVEFIPDANFVGKAAGISIRRQDNNEYTTEWYSKDTTKVPVNEVLGTMDGLYIPTVIDLTSEVIHKTIQGTVQSPETVGAISYKNMPTSAKLLDATGAELGTTTSAMSEGKQVGTYTVATNGQLTFTPNKDFHGAVDPIFVEATDASGEKSVVKYTPEVVPVTPTSENSSTSDVQGAVQKSEVVFDTKDADGKTINFDKGTGTVDNAEKSVDLDTTTLTLVGAGDIQPVGGKVTIPGQGEYIIIEENGKKYVQFTPEKTFVGSATPVTVQVKDANGTAITATYTPTTVGVKPTATAATSKDVQGIEQSGTVTFEAGKATIGTEEKNVPIKANSAVLLDANNQPATGAVDALDPQGNKVGKYTIDPATNKVTFTPTNKSYTGIVQPAKVRAEDENGTPVETTYTPEITPVTPVPTDKTSTNVQGAEQTGTPTIKEGDSKVPMNKDEFKLLDKDGVEVTGDKTPAYSKDGSKVVGTYTYDKAKGTVIFTPTDKTFTGEVLPATIQGKDTNGTVAKATYTPTIVPVTPSAKDGTSKDLQGATQEKEVTFTPGTGNVDGTDVPVALNSEKYTLLGENNKPVTTVQAKDPSGNVVGTYELKMENGKPALRDGKPVVVFTPTDKTYTGAVSPVTIQGEDTNGTKVTATYTPSIVPVTPKAEPASTTGVQGAVQKAEVVFDNKATDEDKKTLNFDKGTGNVDGTDKPVELNQATLKLVKAGNTTANPDGSVTVEGQGTYSIVEEGGKKYVQFTPVKSYTGEVTPVMIQIQDANGTPIETTYTPSIVSVKPVADNSTTTGKQGEAQISNILYNATNNTDNDDKTLNFAKGTTTIEGTEASVALDKKSVALVKATDGTLNQDGTLTVAGQGTYSLVKNDEGEVTGVKFTPLASYTGAVNPVTVKIADENGTEVETTYAPTITPVTADAKPATSTGIQGATQTGTPEYTAPEAGVGVTVTPKYSLVNADQDGKVVVENVGTYSVDDKGVVTFVPVAGYTGTPTEGVKVKVDYTLKAGEGNETVISAETTYTPTVTAVTATGESKTSTGIQGDEQKGKPTFTVSDDTNIQKQDDKPKVVYSLEGANDEGKVVVKDGDKVLYTYSVDKDSGEVTFTPASDYKGQPQPATVKATFTLETADTTDNTTAEITATATYTPSIVPVTPKAAPAETKGVQGAEQASTISYDAENNTDNDAKTLNFAKGTETVNNEEKSKDLDKKSVKLVGAGDGANAVQPSADGTVEVPNQGKYELVKDPDGTVTGVKFTPVKTFTGKATPVKVQILDVNGTPVETTFTPEIVGVTPTATPATSKDIQGATQEKEVTFTPGKTSIDGTDVSVELDTTKFTLLGEDNQPATEVQAKDPAGKEVGKYTLKVENGKPVAVFTPTDKSYTGTVTPVTIRGEDINGTKVTATYTPEIVKVTPTATPKASTGIQGATQEGTPTFTGGEVDVDGTKKTVAIDTDAPAKLIDPTTGNPTDETSIKVDGEGTYTIDPITGKVTFTPEKTFTGPAKGIDVQRVDTNGTPATAKYTPTVIGVTPKGTDVVTEDIQGAVQKDKPVFTPGKAKIDEQDKEVPLDDKVPAKLVDSEGKDLPLTEGKYVVPKEGTYEVTPDGTVTFTPEKTFTGKGTGVTVQRVDTNGTPATAKYTPVVKPAQPSSKPAITTGIQGQEQTGQPTFITGKTTVGDVEKEVPLDNNVPAKLVDSEGKDLPLTDGKYVVPKEGTYEVAPDGTVTFTPDKTFTGQATGVSVKRVDNNGTPVIASYTPVVFPVAPNAEDVTSTDVQGEAQTGKPRFTAGTTMLNGNKVTVEIDETVAPVIVDSEGNPVTLTDGKYVVPNEGTYEITSDGTVTFTPEKTFTGQAKGVTVKRVDKNGTPATATYKPTVVVVTPTATPADSTGIQGAEQSGTPTFAPGKGTGDKGEKTVPLKENSYKLLDKAGKEVPEGQTTPAYGKDGKEIGTYSVDKATGKVTFIPTDKTYTGKVTPATVQGEDVNGTPTTTTYTPSIVPVAPVADKAETTGKQGEVQISNISYDAEKNTDNDNTTLNFAKGTETVNKKEESVALNKKSVTLVKADNGTVNPDGSITVANQGKYELVKDTDGNVTGVKFSPLASHTGPVNPVTVRILDENGTPVETTYTPSVEAVSAKAEGTTSTGIQGSTQTGIPTYTAPETGKDVTVTPKYTLKGANPEGKVVVENVGAYSVDKDGVVTFVPVAGYTGTPEGVTVEVVYTLTAADGSTTDLDKVEAKYVPTVNEVTAEGKDKDTANIQGQTQKTTLEFSVSDDTNIVKDENNKPKATYSLEGANSEGKVVVEGVGTYSVNPTTGEVTFEPEKTYVTKLETPAHTVTVKATYVLETADKDDTTTKEITATAKYTPTVTPVTPTSTPAESTGVQGTVQEGTPIFKEGDNKVPMAADKFKLLDKDGKEVPEGQTTPAYGKDGKEIGTYSIDKATGKVTFTPTDKTYTGEVTPATVQGEDENGTKDKTTYTPKIVKVTPKGIDVPTEDAKGKTQSATPVFEGGKVTINEKEETVAIDTTVPAKFIDPTTGQPTNENTITVKGEGTYVLNPTTGTITFTPEPNYAGTATGITIERVDTNGTPARATYTPTVRPETKFVDKDGNPIPGTTTEDGKVDPKTIKGYKRTGTKISPNGDIEYIYEKVTTSYLDENGNPIPTYPTEDGELPKADIPGYQYVRTIVDENGNIKHIYKKVISSIPQKDIETSYVDENGKPIRPTEKGTKGKKDIPGYEYVRTVVDANGNVSHIYRKVVALAKAKQLPNTEATNSAENAAGLTLVGLIAAAVAARRRRKDK